MRLVLSSLLCAMLALVPHSAALADPKDSVGRVNIAGYRSLEMCSGTLIRPDTVLTAAHCITRPEDGYARRIADMVFVAGWDGESHGGASRVRAVEVHPEAYAGGRLDIRHDLALITLSEPLETPTMPVGRAAPGGPFTLMGYPRSTPQRVYVENGCDGVRSGGLWRIGCSVEKGQSGGPVFYGEGDTQRVVAVIIGISDGAALAVPVDNWLRRRLAAR
ncbi:serine protease [Cognatishimia sp. F0-27]|uniref:trypsin-like serine peptidase n=1 Tax=Cognatishimia sp. F0-27 TaxID=2816855 RepID=UPI001D0C0D51|nr:trypsin-like peptidase domain-containing protein [Cognatishimia sp. F0-27]MCC1491599.1 trypsin-like peptidase domain-containing protein [Cognatishimia sp. F0-27]